ncbi:MAG: hypothetical protein ACKO61_00080 [Actinomycetota bacterium]
MTMTLEPTRASHHDDAPPTSSAPSAGIIDFNAPATAGLVMYECQRVRTDLGVRIEAVRAELIERIDGTRTDLSMRIEAVQAELIERIDGVRADLTEQVSGLRAEMIERIEGLRAEMYRLVNRQTLQILGIMITLLTAQTALLLALL